MVSWIVLPGTVAQSSDEATIWHCSDPVAILRSTELGHVINFTIRKRGLRTRHGLAYAIRSGKSDSSWILSLLTSIGYGLSISALAVNPSHSNGQVESDVHSLRGDGRKGCQPTQPCTIYIVHKFMISCSTSDRWIGTGYGFFCREPLLWSLTAC